MQISLPKPGGHFEQHLAVAPVQQRNADQETLTEKPVIMPPMPQTRSRSNIDTDSHDERNEPGKYNGFSGLFT